MWLKNAFKVAGVFTAIILGAGFASGQELLSFFVRYGREGFIGIAVTGIIFALTGWAVMELCHSEHITSYNDFLELILGKSLGRVVEGIVVVFLFILFSAMLAAAGAVAKEFFKVSFSAGALAMAFICFFTFIFGLEALVKINAFLAPIMVVGGIYIGLATYHTQMAEVFLINPRPWIMSSFVYASYNIITAITVLTTLDNLVTNKKSAFLGAMLGGLAISILGMCMALPLFLNESLQGEIPLLDIIMRYNKAVSYFYIFILLSAIYTTAAANGYAFINWITGKIPVLQWNARIIVCTVAFLASHVGFSNYVGKIYPLFGYIGMFEIIIILLYFIAYKFKKIQI